MSFIPVNEPLLNGNEKKYIDNCIDTGWISSEGPYVKEFEDKFSSRVGRKFGIAVCNGTAALEAAVIAAGIKKGDEVILPSFTIISCASSIIRAGGIPVLVDSENFTWNMNVNQVRQKITKKTRAIMIVHIYGLPADIDPVLELAEEFGLKVIEDAAELIGQTYKGRPCGSFGDVSTFSFYPNKHITTGEGGMIVTDDEEIAVRCRSLRNLCFKPEKRFVHDELGFNFRMTNLQAALGLAQFERLDEFIERKRNTGKLYNDHFRGFPFFGIPLEKTDYAENIYWVYGILLNRKSMKNAEYLMKLLSQNNIGTRPFFYPMHMQPVLRNMGLFKNENYPVSENLAEYGFYIPSGLALTEDQINKTAEVLKSVF